MARKHCLTIHFFSNSAVIWKLRFAHKSKLIPSCNPSQLIYNLGVLGTCSVCLEATQIFLNLSTILYKFHFKMKIHCEPLSIRYCTGRDSCSSRNEADLSLIYMIPFLCALTYIFPEKVRKVTLRYK